MLYLDAVAYGAEELGFVSDVVARSGKYQTGSSVTGPLTRSLGSQRILFGTDHPFFPPLTSTEKWRSVVENLEAIDAVQGWSQADKEGVRGGNALSLLI
jgi:aminocarboxymuconate-semialdehyde decarboxylase